MYHDSMYPMYFLLLFFLAFIKHLPVYYDSFFLMFLMCVENFYHSYVMQFFSFHLYVLAYRVLRQNSFFEVLCEHYEILYEKSYTYCRQYTFNILFCVLLCVCAVFSFPSL